MNLGIRQSGIQIQPLPHFSSVTLVKFLNLPKPQFLQMKI